jgi:pimeloyl-ACP methyl ester carboxylesterase
MGEPILLLHGLGMSARAWDPLVPALRERYDVLVPTLLGHRGGSPASHHPVTVRDFVDDVERALDAAGIGHPYVAGNSLGGWVALELARRGRARGVCALSPAESWRAGTADQWYGVRKIRNARRAARVGRVLRLSGALRRRAVRRFVFRDVAVRGERVTPGRAVDAIEDLLGCAVFDDVFSTTEELEPLDPLPCPVVLAWSGADAILPLAVNGILAWSRIPGATFEVLPGTGHVPMIDDPAVVLDTILRSVAAARAAATAS